MGMMMMVLMALMLPGATAHGILTTPAPRAGTSVAGGNKGRRAEGGRGGEGSGRGREGG